ncbi:hypothetical protein LL037_13095 [Clostridium estertheticum]|uniref:hypothetical protein n=1 Tax=Clostridium estertheticum TaxID=238834 RepID=UPI001C0AC1D5|nr:hypothetical protein [Clostridium estertheticum]MBU3202475.1 hypothetical protein [Clostridium estertheticum]WAG63430.1 hypothetical protein LL037_13095 [Clostridium estertheticum]
MKIYYTDEYLNEMNSNPFSIEGNYGKEWAQVIICDDITGQYSFNNTSGELFTLKINSDYNGWEYRLSDYIQYENYHYRNVIVKENEQFNLKDIVNRYHIHGFDENIVRETDPRWIVHSTTKKNLKAINSSGYLKSIRVLIDEGYDEIGIGLAPFGEPDDYEEHIMFEHLYGCSELVVNSRNIGKVCTDPNIRYNPGIRMYFDAHKIILDGFAVRDGAHIIKVKDKIRITDYIVYMYDETNVDLPKGIDFWTPSLFTDEANKSFLKVYGK